MYYEKRIIVFCVWWEEGREWKVREGEGGVVMEVTIMDILVCGDYWGEGKIEGELESRGVVCGDFYIYIEYSLGPVLLMR